MKSVGKPRSGAVRKVAKGSQVGSGGQGRQALEGKGPTPKAEDRSWHPAGKRKAANDRYRVAVARTSAGGGDAGARRGGSARRGASAPRRAAGADSEVIAGRNSIVEALRARIPATTLYLAHRVEMDERLQEILKIATNRQIAILEITRPELDRITGDGMVHQGIALKVPPYKYAHPTELLDGIQSRGELPLLVALDGITDPRNLGAILRSVGAFGGQGVIIPQRRSVGVNATAWKTSAGAAARVPVAMAPNLTQTLKELKTRGLFVVGLDGDGEISLPGLSWANHALVIVIGSEGKGISRLVTETCDAIVRIPIAANTESLNAGIATSISLYEIARIRAE